MFHLLSSPPVQSRAAVLFVRTQAMRPMPALRGAVLGILAVLGSAGTALAQHDATSSIIAKQTDAETLAFTVSNPTHKRMQVQVTHQENHKRLMDDVNHEGSYGCRLRFGKLTAGQYTVRVRVGRDQYRYHVQVQAQSQMPATISVQELPALGTEPTVASAAE